MKGVIALVLAITIAAVSPITGRAGAQDPDQAVSIGTTEITVDVVVRDKKGRAVRDLSAADFQIEEDGAPQDVASFRLVTRGGGAASAGDEMASSGGADVAVPSSGGALGETTLARSSAVAIVFDRLSPEGRLRAQRAALEFVNDMGPSDLVGVYTVDLSLRVRQPFTNDAAAVRAAITGTATENSATYSTNSDQIVDLMTRQSSLDAQSSSLEQQAGGGATGQAGGAAAQAAGNDIGATAVERITNEMTLRSLERFNDLERDQQGYATTNGLLAVATALARVPGRKAIIFFSEGIQITSNTEAHFRSVVGNANRAGVSIYPVDAAGLRAVSVTSEAAKELAAAGNRRLDQVGSGRDVVSEPLGRGFERSQDLLKKDPEVGFRELAAGTGGVVISGTNDPGSRLRLVDEDLRTHYVLTYVPKNQDFDGQYRRIAVKVKRSDVDVQARQGYYAIDAVGTVAVLPYEAPALAVLKDETAVSTVPVRLQSLVFPEATRPGRTQVLVNVPASQFTCATPNNGETFQTDFTILAVVRDQSGRIVTKLSNHYQLAGPADKKDDFKKSDVLFAGEVELAPGAYTVESVAYDATSKVSGLASERITVPAADGLRMSSIVIVGRADRLSSQDKKIDSPLHVGEMLIYPNLGAPLSKSEAKKLAFFVTLYTAPKGPAPKLTLELLHNGKQMAKFPLDIPAPDANGQIRQASAVPLDDFTPGAYVLRLTATDGKKTAANSTLFMVVP